MIHSAKKTSPARVNSMDSNEARPSSFVAPSRETARRIQSFIAAAPELEQRYARAKEFRRILRQVSNVDVTSRCNLRCEGCFYFEGDDYKQATEEEDLAALAGFFRRPGAARCQPCEPRRRRAGAGAGSPRNRKRTHPPRRNLYQRTIKIRPSINYSIVISIWGDAETTEMFRGGGTFWKALRTHRGDRRARALFTVHAKNIGRFRKSRASSTTAVSGSPSTISRRRTRISPSSPPALGTMTASFGSAQGRTISY